MSKAEGKREQLRIGVTGHRVLSSLARVTQGVDEALDRIQRDYPAARRTIVSSLAEGADRLVVKHARARGINALVVPLPLPRDEYVKDFPSPESREEFSSLLVGADKLIELPPATSRASAYAAAGQVIVDQSDVLIAVWDGLAAQGEAGTGDVVTRARERGLPVAWVHAGNRRPGTNDPTSLGDEQGFVTFERFPSQTTFIGTPAAEDSLARIKKAVAARDALALQYQARRLGFARFAIALGPLAVLLLAVQALIFPAGGAIAVGLILTELVALAAALAIGFLEMGQSHGSWIRQRLRAEILRREVFLVRARAGPYLTTPDPDLVETVDERLSTLDNDMNDPAALILLEGGGQRWQDALEDARLDSSSVRVPDLKNCVTNYLLERVIDQRRWFAAKSLEHGHRARVYENGAKTILMVALIAAGLHLGLLLAGERIEGGSIHHLTIFVAILAPAVGSMFVALQSVSGSHRLNRSYTLRERALEHPEKILRRLQTRLDHGSRNYDELQFQFRRAVLQTEDILAADLLQWWLIMHTEAPKAVS